RRAVGLGIDAPVPIRVVQQPILRIGALHHQDLAQLASLAHAAHVLHDGVEAQVVGRAVAQVLLQGQGDQLPRILYRSGQRLLADHVLARVERVGHHREVQRVRRAHVDHIHLGIVQNLMVVAGGLIDVELFGQPAGLLLLALADRVDLDEAQAANPFQVHAPHEARAENRSLQSVNHDCLLSEVSNLTQLLIEWYAGCWSASALEKVRKWSAHGARTGGWLWRSPRSPRLRGVWPRGWAFCAWRKTPTGPATSPSARACSRTGRCGSLSRDCCRPARTFLIATAGPTAKARDPHKKPAVARAAIIVSTCDAANSSRLDRWLSIGLGRPWGRPPGLRGSSRTRSLCDGFS